jgi:predicted  nucleic acid-binding Zn-ribbon protein
MSDDSSDRRDGSPTTASFEEWLSQQAESQGISQQELFERLVSSYWTLNELVQLLDDSGNTTSLADIYPGDDSDLPDGKDAGSAPVLGGSEADSDEDRRRDRDRREPRRRNREDRNRTHEETAELRTQIEELHDRIDDLESELGDERERGQSQDGLIEALADRLSGIEADLSELESASASGRESLSADQAALERRLDDLETDFSDLEADLGDLEADFDGRQKQLASEQERLRSRLNSEFDELETILRYLVSQTDDLDAGLATVEQRHDEALSQLQWERSAMRSLLREASAHDAHIGECESCGADINLDLLAEPYCTECDSLLTGIEENDKWLFFSDIVVTAEETPAAGENRVASSTGSRPSEPEPTPDPSGPPNTAAGHGAESSGTPAKATTQHTASQASDAEPMRSTADEHEATDERSAPSHDPHSDAATGDTSEPPDSGMFDFGTDEPEPESEPSPEPDLDTDTDTDAAVSEDEESRSAFSFGGAASDPGSSSDRDAESDTGSGGAEEAPVDSPFGDLDDLKQKEESDDE